MATRAARARERRALRRLRSLIFFAFFLSGFAGLMHQVVWAKLLVPLVGATAHAQATVLAVFLGGLALGAARFGRRVDRLGRPLRTYVALEVAVGVYGLLLPLLVGAAGLVYVALASRFFQEFQTTGLGIVLRLVLSVFAILIPAVCMGGTLPVLARHLVARVEDTRREVADLYALNGFGAVLGAGVAGFAVLPWLGTHGGLVVASLLNLVAGGLLLPAARRETLAAGRGTPGGPGPARREARHKASYRPLQYRVALGALGLSGFAALGYEILFTRVIALSMGASTYAFSVMLMGFITGIALGSLVVSRLRVRRPLWLFGVSQLAVAASLFAVGPLVSRLPYWVTLLRVTFQGDALGFELYTLTQAGLCVAILLLPTTCLGFAFPLVAQIETRSPEEVGWRVGSTYAWNTVGNVLGAIATGLVLLPALGMLGAFHVNLALNFVAGGAVLLVAEEAAFSRRLAAGIAAGAALALYSLAGTAWLDPVRYAAGHLDVRRGPGASLGTAASARHPVGSFESWKRYHVPKLNGTLLFFEEDAHATVLVAGTAPEQAVLFVNGKPDASLTLADLDTQLLLGHAPLFLVLHARSALVIGYGAGITAGAVLRHPLERLDIIEISRGVLHADAVFAGHNHGALRDPRVRVYEDDGLSFLRTAPQRYDVVISEPSNPWVAGVASLFTVEFFETVRDRLRPGGVFTFWFHTYSQNDESVALVLRSLARVFPHVTIFADNDFGNAIAVASAGLLRPDFAGMERRFAEPAVAADLARLGMRNLESLLTHNRITSEGFRALVTAGPLNTLSHQRLEYAAPRVFFSGENSFLLESVDPLVRGDAPPADVLLDHYLRWRASTGRPASRAALEEAARYAHSLGGHGKRVAAAVRARVPRPAGAPR